jgi:phosphohistidine swiveling domain-containing protein
MTKEEEIEWVRLFKRESELLIVYQVPIGRKYYPETLRIDFQPRNLKHEGWFYYADKRDLIQEYSVVKQQWGKNPAFLTWLADRMEMDGEDLVGKTRKLAIGLKEKTNYELRDTFKKCDDLFSRYMPFVWIIFTVEKLLTDSIKIEVREKLAVSDEEIGQYLNTLLSVPFKESATVREQRQMLKTASLLKKAGHLNPEIEDRIFEIYKEFYWAGAMRVGWTYLKDSYSLDHYLSLVGALTQGNPDKDLEKLDQTASDLRKEYDEFLSRRPLNKDIIRLANLLRRFIFLRTYRGEIVVKTMANIRPVLEEIAGRFGLRLEDIVYLTSDEIIEALGNGRLPEYETRKKGYKLLVLDGVLQVIAGIELPQLDYSAVRELRGEGIVGGVVKGKVKRIMGKEDVTKLAKGEILVAQMTSPDMMFAIMKASAIVTDEGGLTCHAALISRELQIPCVISTEIATKVFKDGDLVLVNSKDGIVRREG